MMASKEECDRYANELVQRFEELTSWAITHWPRREFPLLRSDFSASRREIAQIAGPKLGQGDEHSPSAGLDKTEPQYRDVHPMPWP